MSEPLFAGKTILVTGGTGSFGSRFVQRVLKDHQPRKVVVLSRDELKQSEMSQRIPDERVRFFLGDVRDAVRLQRAFYGVDAVIHAAALKQVPTLEYNPFEAVQTNIIGAENVVNAAIDQGVERVVSLSTDKAVNPVNLYGATKLCAEKLMIAANSYSGLHKTRFSVVRYGNVVGSRGSVVPVFLKKKAEGRLPVTDARMTRFWITLDQAVDLVYLALSRMHGGEVFVPRIPSMRIADLAEAIAPGLPHDIIGVRPGEKMHEVLITEDESPRTVEMDGYYVIKPLFAWWANSHFDGGKPLPEGFKYSSESNPLWLKPADLARMVTELAHD